MPKTAVIPGSFDPITNGHLNIIERAASLFDEVIVAVLVNQDKQSLFSLDARLEMIGECVEHLPNVRTTKFTGLLVDYVINTGSDVVVRGLRGSADFDYELQMARINKAIGPIETIFIPAAPEFAHVSSSIVKQVARLHGDVESLVPQPVARQLRALFSEGGLI